MTGSQSKEFMLSSHRHQIASAFHLILPDTPTL